MVCMTRHTRATKWGVAHHAHKDPGAAAADAPQAGATRWQ
jgi:hypothetical protein